MSVNTILDGIFIKFAERSGSTINKAGIDSSYSCFSKTKKKLT